MKYRLDLGFEFIYSFASITFEDNPPAANKKEEHLSNITISVLTIVFTFSFKIPKIALLSQRHQHY